MRRVGLKLTTFGCDLLANWMKTKRMDYTANGGEKEVSVSTEDRSVEHDDYYNRRRTNYSGGCRTMLIGN